MQVESDVQHDGFQPIELKITIETVHEAEALYAIFNHTHNVELLRRRQAEAIRGAIGAGYYSANILRRDGTLFYM